MLQGAECATYRLVCLDCRDPRSFCWANEFGIDIGVMGLSFVPVLRHVACCSDCLEWSVAVGMLWCGDAVACVQ